MDDRFLTALRNHKFNMREALGKSPNAGASGHRSV